MLADIEVITSFVSHLAALGNPGLKVDRRPEKENRGSPDIDAIAGPFAIEHTSVDTIPNQRRDSDYFVKALRFLENEFRSKLPYRLTITLPYEGVKTGQDWSRINAAVQTWVIKGSPKLSMGSHTIKNVPGIPFEFYASKRSSSNTGVVFKRVAPDDQTLPVRLREQLDRKIMKLSPYKDQNKTTVLLIESGDIALMSDGIMWDALRMAYPNGLPQGLDQIWFADTAIPEEILFIDMTQAVRQG